MSQDARLTLVHLSVSIGAKRVLDDISIKLLPHRITALVGESGSGKSMTALAVMGLLPQGAVATGAVQLHGTGDLLALREAALCAIRGRKIAMIFQEPMTALNPVMQIGAQVAEALLVHGLAENRREAMAQARAVLDRVGLSQIGLDRYPHELSGGQRQRAAIAAAIAPAPDILIADEATTALDVTTQSEILDLLRQLVREDGMSMLLITHDLAVVADMADEIAVLAAGKIVEAAPTTNILQAPQHPYTQTLLAAASPAPRAKRVIEREVVLQASDVTRIYPARRRGLRRSPPMVALKNVSLTLRRGECLGLVGGSGCGKSTLARALLGLEEIQSGAIDITGRAVSPNMSPADRRRISIVFQDPYGSFNPRWPVKRIIAEPLDLIAVSEESRASRVETALVQVGLSPEDAQKFPHQFSGGQRQRIAIARALITKPDILVLDEAVSALDVSVRARVLDLLKSLQEDLQLSYIFITHDLSVVAHMADRIAVMQAGQIVETGPAAELLTNPKQQYTQNLLKAAPRLTVPMRRKERT
ncbi:ABC transporter ATP-binding protein [Rhodobacteraceae bacterium XHP0102]|nr:ABC transporter ATP-binding protein [Rhodobacteraceae bacterium XHP0102]